MLMGNDGKDKKKLMTSKALTGLIQGYYQDLVVAKQEGRPIAWVCSPVPMEICYAMGITPVLPENYAAVLSSRKLAGELCEVGETKGGYDREICSYTRCYTGSQLLKKGAFGDEGPPLPDILVATRTGCATQVKWWENLSRQLDIPLFVVDASYRVDEPVGEHHVRYFAGELKGLISFLEDQTHRKMDPAALEEAVQNSLQSDQYWAGITRLRKAKPAPISPIEIFTNMFPLMVLSGTNKAVDFYGRLFAEVEELVKQKQGVLPDEKFRLMWDMFPLWYDLSLVSYFEKFCATFVIDIYANAMSCTLSFDPESFGADPFEFLTAKYLRNPSSINASKLKSESYKKLIREYSVDGMVFHLNRSCRYTSMIQMSLLDNLQKDPGIPCMTFEGDMADPRTYNAEKVRAEVDAFMEVLAHNKS
jgi:benzoyl-CoA reductase/2-hydroxyglutaryl-CoA dehydratase subunit BcrC/BadD/HgdB